MSYIMSPRNILKNVLQIFTNFQRNPLLASKLRSAPLQLHTEAVALRFPVKTVILEISQNLQENPCAGVSFLIKLQALAS